MGRISGHNRDKIQEFAVELSDSVHIQTPVLDAAYASFECRLHDTRPYGELAVQVREDCFDRQGMLDPSQIKPLLYMGSDFYMTVDPDTLEHKLP